MKIRLYEYRNTPLSEMAASLAIINILFKKKNIEEVSSEEWKKVIAFFRKEWPIAKERTEFRTLREYINSEMISIPRVQRIWDGLTEDQKEFFWKAVSYIEKNL